jgi:hypothetical protein
VIHWFPTPLADAEAAMSHKGNDDPAPPRMDSHRTASRRALRGGLDPSEVRSALTDIERFHFGAPARSWPELAAQASYLLRLFSTTPEAQHPSLKRMINSVLEDLQRLVAHS